MAEARKSTAGRKSDVKGLTRRRSNDEAAPALDAAGEEVVCELLSDVWDRTVEAITVAAVDKLTPAFTAEYMCRSLFTVLAWGDLAHDEVPSGEAFLRGGAGGRKVGGVLRAGSYIPAQRHLGCSGWP